MQLPLSPVEAHSSFLKTTPCGFRSAVGHTDHELDPTFSFLASVSSSAILAHFCQKLGSSKEMSVLFPDATKLAWEWKKMNEQGATHHPDVPSPI